MTSRSVDVRQRPTKPRASAYSGKWGQPWEMDEKLKSENMQKEQFSESGWGKGRCRERRYADHIFIQMYFRMHRFVVKFSQFSSPQAAGGALTP